MDDLDRAIVRLLQQEGRLTNQDLAARVGLTPAPCLRRVRRLEQEGVITGYAAVVIKAMTVSALCCLAAGLFFDQSLWLVAPFVLVWGFFVVADSAQFSAMVTEAAPRHAVGTALTLQTSLGFLLTMVTIQLIPAVVEAAGWRLAFPVLALGPAAGIAAIRRLVRVGETSP